MVDSAQDKVVVENNSLSGDKARAAVKESAEEMKARVREKMGDHLASQLTNGVLNAVSEAGDVAMAGGDTILDAAMALASCATGDSYCSTAISDLSKKDQAAGNVLNSLVSGDAWNAIQTTAVKASQGNQVALENLAGILTGIVVPSSKVTFSGKGSSVTEQTAKSTNSLADYVKENIALSKKSRESSNFSQFIKAEGAVQESLGIWPPNRGAYGPVEQVTLPTGTVVDRYGYPGGSFVSPVGVPFENRALPSSYETTKPYFQYEIIKPVPDVPKSNILPWFGQKGTGTQYELPQSVQWYLDNDYMKKVEK
jgi:filamentous hemagglutinin